MSRVTVERTPPARAARESLADVVLRRFPVGPDELAEAREMAESAGVHLEMALLEGGAISDEQIAVATGDYLGIPAVSLAHFTPDTDLLACIPPRIVDSKKVLPLGRWGHTLAVALHDPFDVTALDELNVATGQNIVCYAAPPTQILSLLKEVVSARKEGLEDVLRDVGEAEPAIELLEGKEDEVDEDEMMELAEHAPVVRVVNAVLVEALQRGASDIHFEPMANCLHVRYRVDGILYDEPAPPPYMHAAIISRLKIISGLDIGERRLPQDGRFTIHAFDRDTDVRVSIVPSIHGQKAVLRLLDKVNLKPNLAAIGLAESDYEEIEHAIRQPSGLILVTGPTGSGKTTTLYSALQELNEPSVHIVTVEDPVEYELPRVIQIQTRPEIGLTFGSGLRAILRQDPDIIMVGEIRDPETAGIAIQASLTGHLVLSTLHTIDAPGAIARLLHMKVEPFLVSSSLLMAQAQRLYRKLCPHCKRKRAIPLDILQKHRIDPGVFEGFPLYGPQGCTHCGHLGYRGRDAIMEILPVDEEVRELILRDASSGAIRKHAVAKGMATLREAGLRRVMQGDTTIEEILRVSAER